MSFGLAELNHEYKTVKELLHRADVAVYAAKLNGRNQCCVYSRDLMNVLNA